MTPPVVEMPKAVRASGRQHSIAAKRIRYVSKPPPGAKVLRTFRKPKTCVAVEEAVELTDLRPDGPGDTPTDSFMLVMLPADGMSEAKQLRDSWMVPSDRFDDVPTTSFTSNSCKIQWRPGKATVQGTPQSTAHVVEALVTFAFLEGELRRVEKLLESQEAVAPSDVPRAHRIRFRDRKEWRRIGETIERLYDMRLTYGRLEAQFELAPHTLPRDSREVMERLVEETGIDHRMEGFSNRLEGCEDLYEGANDRIADYHWYVEGGWMEAIIILLLVFEVVLMATDIYVKHGK
jgi:hypothetical protein